MNKKLILSTIVAALAFIGVGTAFNAQPVAAKTKIIMVKSTKQQNHYIKLANRKGTHYFKGYKVKMQSFSVGTDCQTYEAAFGDTGYDTGSPVYKMNGTIDHDSEYLSDGYQIEAIGTKTVNGKHFFISKDEDGKYLNLASDFYMPTSYRIKKGHKMKLYCIPFPDDLKDPSMYPTIFPATTDIAKQLGAELSGLPGGYLKMKKKSRLLITSPKCDSLNSDDGETYLMLFDETNDVFTPYGMGDLCVRQSDVKKNLVKAKGTFNGGLYAFNGNKIIHNWYDDDYQF